MVLTLDHTHPLSPVVWVQITLLTLPLWLTAPGYLSSDQQGDWGSWTWRCLGCWLGDCSVLRLKADAEPSPDVCAATFPSGFCFVLHCDSLRIMSKCQCTSEQVHKVMFWENTKSHVTDPVMHVEMCYLIMVLLTMKNEKYRQQKPHFLYLKAC